MKTFHYFKLGLIVETSPFFSHSWKTFSSEHRKHPTMKIGSQKEYT